MTLILAGSAGPALACSCARILPADLARTVDVAITGTVLEVRSIRVMGETGIWSVGGIEARIAVAGRLKGEAPDEVVIHSLEPSAVCGWTDYRPGRAVTILARRAASGRLNTNACVMSSYLADRDAVEEALRRDHRWLGLVPGGAAEAPARPADAP